MLPSVPEMEGICPWGASFFEDVPLVEFMSLGLTCMPGELLLVTQVFVVVLVLHILNAD